MVNDNLPRKELQMPVRYIYQGKTFAIFKVLGGFEWYILRYGNKEYNADSLKSAVDKYNNLKRGLS
jgi:hypothetical protein